MELLIMDNESLALIRLLLARLERISADSYWAHQASGVRGSLMRALEALEDGSPVSTANVTEWIGMGFHILEKASAERFR